MKSYHPLLSFGESEAAFEDHERGDERETVEYLARMSEGGPALELAIGAGRIALPLAATGVRVDGIDFSEAMVSRMRAKPGGGEITMMMGDFADVDVEGSYRLIYILYNSLFN